MTKLQTNYAFRVTTLQCELNGDCLTVLYCYSTHYMCWANILNGRIYDGHVLLGFISGMLFTQNRALFYNVHCLFFVIFNIGGHGCNYMTR